MEGRMVRQLELLAARTPDPAQAIRSLGWFGAVIEESMVAHSREGAGE
jgi:hypothetical protein